MNVYSVHYRHEDGASLAALADKAVLVKDGFSWPALVFGPAWLVWRGMWLVLALYVAAMLVLAAAVRLAGLPEGAVFLINAAIGVMLGLEGNGLYRWTLERRRYRERAVTTGDSLAEAEERFLSAHAATRSGAATGSTAP